MSQLDGEGRDGAGAVGQVSSPRYEADELRYTAQVVDEAMRLYPPAHTVVRRAAEKTELLGYPAAAS